MGSRSVLELLYEDDVEFVEKIPMQPVGNTVSKSHWLRYRQDGTVENKLQYRQDGTFILRLWDRQDGNVEMKLQCRQDFIQRSM